MRDVMIWRLIRPVTCTVRATAVASQVCSRWFEVCSSKRLNSPRSPANYKHYHWQIHGVETLDPLAERVRMIGQDPPLHDMLQEADRNVLSVVREMRNAARVANEQGDPGTVDLFSRLVQVHHGNHTGER